MRPAHGAALAQERTRSRAESMEILSGNAAESPGLCLCLLLFRKWTAGRVSSEKNTALIASTPYLIVAFICVLGLKCKSSLAFNSLWIEKKESFALCKQCLHSLFCPVTDTSSLGNAAQQTRTASSSEFQILTDFPPCPLILAQHSSFSCKARKRSKKPRCIIHIHALQHWLFSRYKSVQCRFLFPE